MQECGLQVPPNNILMGFETGEEMTRELNRRIENGMKVDAKLIERESTGLPSRP